jgi:hypothetical protein
MMMKIGLKILNPQAFFKISVPPGTLRDVIRGIWLEIIVPAFLFACAFTGFIVALRFGLKFVLQQGGV